MGTHWTQYDWAINEASKANNLDAFIDNIKIKRNDKRRKRRTRMGDYRPACPVGSRSVSGLA